MLRTQRALPATIFSKGRQYAGGAGRQLADWPNRSCCLAGPEGSQEPSHRDLAEQPARARHPRCAEQRGGAGALATGALVIEDLKSYISMNERCFT